MKPRNVWGLSLAAASLAFASLRHRRQRHAACDRLPIMEGLALRGEWEGWWDSEQADPSDAITLHPETLVDAAMQDLNEPLWRTAWQS